MAHLSSPQAHSSSRVERIDSRGDHGDRGDRRDRVTDPNFDTSSFLIPKAPQAAKNGVYRTDRIRNLSLQGFTFTNRNPDPLDDKELRSFLLQYLHVVAKAPGQGGQPVEPRTRLVTNLVVFFEMILHFRQFWGFNLFFNNVKMSNLLNLHPKAPRTALQECILSYRDARREYQTTYRDESQPSSKAPSDAAYIASLIDQVNDLPPYQPRPQQNKHTWGELAKTWPSYMSSALTRFRSTTGGSSSSSLTSSFAPKDSRDRFDAGGNVDTAEKWRHTNYAGGSARNSPTIDAFPRITVKRAASESGPINVDDLINEAVQPKRRRTSPHPSINHMSPVDVSRHRENEYYEGEGTVGGEEARRIRHSQDSIFSRNSILSRDHTVDDTLRGRGSINGDMSGDMVMNARLEEIMSLLHQTTSALTEIKTRQPSQEQLDDVWRLLHDEKMRRDEKGSTPSKRAVDFILVPGNEHLQYLECRPAKPFLGGVRDELSKIRSMMVSKIKALGNTDEDYTASSYIFSAVEAVESAMAKAEKGITEL